MNRALEALGIGIVLGLLAGLLIGRSVAATPPTPPDLEPSWRPIPTLSEAPQPSWPHDATVGSAGASADAEPGGASSIPAVVGQQPEATDAVSGAEQESTPTPTPTPTPKPAYVGDYRLWYPDAGINAGWRWFNCPPPGTPVPTLQTGVWRWGCRRETIYLMAHASSTFAALRRAYHSGALDVDDRAWFADAGRVSRWRVSWIKRVAELYFDTHNNEFIGPAGTMTWQTCDGARSEWRIIVRLVPVP